MNNNGRGPDSLRTLTDKGEMDPKVLICPQSGSEQEEGKWVCDYDSIFDRTGRAVYVRGMEDAEKTMMVWDKKPFHGSSGNPRRCVLFADGNVRRIPEADFQKALAELDHRFPR